MEAGTDQERREEELKEILSYYSSMTSPSSQENIVSMMQEIQELYGWISAEHKEMAAEAAGVKLSVIDCIMKLYKSLKPSLPAQDDVLHRKKLSQGRPKSPGHSKKRTWD